MTEYNVGKSLIYNLKQKILCDYDEIFSEESKKYNISKKLYLLEVFPSIIYNKNKCHSRIWNNGFGMQCSRNIVSNKLCKIHYNELLETGCLKHGHILDEPPIYFKKCSL